MTTLENKINRVSSSFANTTEDKFETKAISKDDASSAKQILQALFNLLKKRKYFAIALVVIITVGFGIYGKYFNLTDAERAQKELANAVASVGELMILPEGDEPVLANVTDAEALIKQQAFFAGAVNGDQLLLFPRNLKAVIYSPSRNKIINAGPIEQQPRLETTGSLANPVSNGASQNETLQGFASVPQNSPLKIAFYNGTKTVGLANEMESKLKSVSSDFETVAKTNAESKDYKETIVVDLTGGAKSAEAQNIALALGAKVGELPSGETMPDADILVIVGGRIMEIQKSNIKNKNER